MLQEEFVSLVKRHSGDRTAIHLWEQIDAAYKDGERYFHTASHIEQMVTALKSVQSQIEDWDTLLFSVFYHDFIYDVVRYVSENDNEDKSAEQAASALQAIGYPPAKIERCRTQILATKHHKPSADDDTNYLTDADLLILGQPWDVYKTYMENIRKEYGVYPDSIYNAGRINVLKNFLRMQKLFKTDYFHNLFETSAKENIEREIEIISLS